VSAGVFQKDIRDFIYSDSGAVVPTGANNGFDGQYAGYTIIRQANGGGAKVRGLELSYQQQFTFLPGGLGGFGGFANYTRLLTEGDYGAGISGSANQVQRFVPKTANAGVSFGRGRIKSRLMVNYIGEHLFTYSSDPSRLLYKNSRTVTNLSLTFNLRRGLEVYADCNNLLHETQRYYRGLGKTNRLATFTDNAPTITFGISGRF
jgi:outer membrane receptor protein involved in Fe transport